MQPFTATISATLILTREEVEYLATSAEHHYDHTVYMLVPPGPGALINGMRTRLWDPGATHSESDYRHRQIQLLYKAIEFQNDPMALNLKARFWKTMHKINHVSERVNDMLAALPSDYL
jgi:hypothetical protein